LIKGKLPLIDRYIGRTVFIAVLLSVVFFTSMLMIFFILDDLPNLGRGTYDITDAIINLILNIPDNVLYIFPMATLVGAIVGLGTLANSSELIVIRATGVSTWHIIKTSLFSIFPLILIIIVMGEWLSPISKQYAQQRRSLAFSNGQLISSGAGLWAKDGKDFVHIKNTLPEGKIENIIRYHFDEEMNLKSIIRAKMGVYKGKGVWELIDTQSSIFEENKVIKQNLSHALWKSQLTLKNLGMASIDPGGLSLFQLWSYIKYLEVNQLDTGKFLLAFWRKIIQPFSIAVMLILGCSFVFSSIRQTSIGFKILSGIFIGLGYYLFSQSMGAVALAYHFPAILGAFSPVLLFGLISQWRLKKIA